MKRLLLIFSLACVTLMAHAQINKMYRKSNKTTTLATIQSTQNNDVKTVNQNGTSNNPVASYRGTINISAIINSKMETEWNASANQFGGNQLKAELWSVVYRPDPNKQNYTQILLQQRISTINSSYQSLAGGVSFSMSNPTANDNLVVVVYCNPLKSAPGLVIKGKPDDGRQTPMHRYESNVKSKLGQNIIYGIYSLVPGKTELNHLDFNFFSVTDDVINDISDVAERASGNSDIVYNNIDVTKSEIIINAYRTKQFKSYPAVAAISWNNSLSNAALQFAKDIAQEGDGGDGTSPYITKSGKSILYYPAQMGFNGGSVFFAVAIPYPDTSDEKTIIDAAFLNNNSSNKDLILSNLMSSQAKKFGIGKYNNRWYIIYST